MIFLGFTGGSAGKESACQYRRCKRPGFGPWDRKIPWRRKWQPTPIFLPGIFYGQRSISSPSLFCKSIWHPDPNKVGFFRDTNWPFSRTAGFPDKVVFLASMPHFLFTGLLCSKQNKFEIGNKSDEPTRRLAACG